MKISKETLFLLYCCGDKIARKCLKMRGQIWIYNGELCCETEFNNDDDTPSDAS